MIYLHTKFHLPVSNGSLLNGYKKKVFHGHHVIYNLQVLYPNKFHIFPKLII